MLHSLKAKFVLAFGTLIVILFLALGAFLLDAKSKELSADIAQGAQSFARLSAGDLMEDYHLYLAPGNFVPFNREVSVLARQNPDIASLSILTYTGVVLYDSAEETTERYTGTVRTLADPEALKRVQSQAMSLLLSDGRTIYVKVNDEGVVSYVNFNEEPITGPGADDQILNIIVPYNNAYAVSYEISYAALAERLATARLQILVIGIAGLLVTLMMSYMLSVSVTNPLKKLKQAALKLAGGDFTTRVNIQSKDELGLLGQTFNNMAADIQLSTQALVYQERVAKELELAAQIQTQLLPKDKYILNKMDMAGGLIPATEVGGDAFDFIKASETRTLAYLGDVTGHGVAAGIVSSIANALIYAFRGDMDLFVMIKALNDVLRKKTLVNVFMTMALFLWDEETEVISYMNAGHPPILYYDAEKKKVAEIRIPGMALSMVDGVEKIVKKHDIQTKPNDVILTYSDGIPEARDAKGEQYGMNRLKRIVQDAADDLYSAEAIKNAVLSDVKQFMGGSEQLDDITIMVLKRKAA